jgi:hypothetical protein
MSGRAMALCVFPALLAWGCGGGSGRSSPPPPAATAVPTTVAAAPARKVDLCAVAPDAEVAKALGAKVRKPAHGSQVMGSECDYDLDFGDGHTGFFFVWAGPPSVYFSREMATGDVESVPDVGQEAFIEHAMPEDAWDLHVRVAPDLALEAKGDRKERVLALGRFLAEKVH